MRDKDAELMMEALREAQPEQRPPKDPKAPGHMFLSADGQRNIQYRHPNPNISPDGKWKLNDRSNEAPYGEWTLEDWLEQFIGSYVSGIEYNNVGVGGGIYSYINSYANPSYEVAKANNGIDHPEFVKWIQAQGSAKVTPENIPSIVDQVNRAIEVGNGVPAGYAGSNAVYEPGEVPVADVDAPDWRGTPSHFL